MYKLTTFEKQVIELLIKLDVGNYEIYKEQLNNIETFERDFTGAGYYLNFKIDNSKHKATNYSSPFGTLTAYKGNEAFVGFMLFVTDCYIDSLECYKFVAEDFSKDVSLIEDMNSLYEKGKLSLKVK